MAADGIVIRPIGDDEVRDFVRVDEMAFGNHMFDEAEVDIAMGNVDVDRALGAYEGDRLIGVAGGYEFDLSLPGGTSVPVTGVSFVAVLPTHRRRGALAGLMDAQLAQITDRGEPASVLLASEAPIYERFGYGSATEQMFLTIDARRAEMRPDAPTAEVSFEIVDGDPFDRLRPIHAAAWARRPGNVSRGDRYWSQMSRYFAHQKKKGRFDVVAVAPGGRDVGYATYELDTDWTSMPITTMTVSELVAVDDETAVALWHYLLSVDLVAKVVAPHAAVDDVIRDLLVDPRAVTTDRVEDHLWLRPADPAALLAARRYRTDDTIVIDVADVGRWRVTVSEGAAVVEETGAEADLAVDRAGLGSLILGAISVSRLVAAGRAHTDPASAARFDALLGWSPSAHLQTFF